jgi:head-tail adaptor
MDKKPFIGQKDRRIVINKKTLLANTSGERKETLVKITDAWAFMDDLSGGEDVEGKVRALYSRAYVVRWQSELLTEKRLVIVDDERTFEVVYVAEIGRKDHVRLVCKAYE